MSGINIGSLSLSDLYVGSTPVQQVYQGSNLIWERTPEDFYLTSDAAFFVIIYAYAGSPTQAQPQYSTDGSTWTAMTIGTTYNFTAGQKCYVRNTTSIWSESQANVLSFNSSCTKIGGNLASLVNYATSLTSYAFFALFNNTSSYMNSLLDISKLELPWTDLSGAGYCYKNMFKSCAKLTTCCKLPATVLSDQCYGSMFYECTALTQLPKLPAIAMTSFCYSSMFSGCRQIKLSTTQTGEYVNAYRLPTTGTGIDLANSRYNMFYTTQGTWSGTPDLNTTYYTSNEVIG